MSVRTDVFSTSQWALWLNNKWWEEITQKASEDDASVKSVNRNPQSTIRNQRGVALKEELVEGKTGDISGEKISGAVVSYFKGNDPSKWKRGIATYEMVSLGEVYKGIELKLKAHGNNVEKLFYVKPGANPEQIRVSLSGLQPQENPPPLSPSVRGTGGCPPLAGAGGGVGARGLLHQELWVNEHGELVAETALGPVKFTKPVAYQEIDGKRVEVECGYAIADGGLQNAECKTNPKSKFRNLSPTPIGEQKSAIRNPNSEIDNPSPDTHHSSHMYGFKVASYDKNHDLIIDPLLASTFLGGDDLDFGIGIALESGGNVFVTGRAGDGTTDLPTTSGAYDTTHNGTDNVFVSKFSNLTTSPEPTPEPSPGPSPSPSPEP